MDTTTERMFLGATEDRYSDQLEFTTPGIYSWVVPVGVTSVSAVGVQGGQGGGSRGGQGGTLQYVNAIAVTPGETLTINVGEAGESLEPGVDGVDSSPTVTYGRSGGHSSIRRGSTYLLATNFSIGTTFAGGVGGVGAANDKGGYNGGGGGGAGGYAGNGGVGASHNANAGAGVGGSGGGGGRVTTGFQSSTYVYGFGGRVGGGVGLRGQGANGTAGISGPVAGNHSEGGRGSDDGTVGANFSLYGGGGGGGSNNISITTGNPNWVAGAPAGSGAIRIIWPGNIRQFPSTRTADE